MALCRRVGTLQKRLAQRGGYSHKLNAKFVGVSGS
jgi:hypothetical protein